MIKMKDENQRDSDNLNEIKVAIYSGTMNKACCSRISFYDRQSDISFILHNGKTVMTWPVAWNTPSASSGMKWDAALQRHTENWVHGNIVKFNQGSTRSCPGQEEAPAPGHAGGVMFSLSSTLAQLLWRPALSPVAQERHSQCFESCGGSVSCLVPGGGDMQGEAGVIQPTERGK